MQTPDLASRRLFNEAILSFTVALLSYVRGHIFHLRTTSATSVLMLHYIDISIRVRLLPLEMSSISAHTLVLTMVKLT